jgi:hypothetical protein
MINNLLEDFERKGERKRGGVGTQDAYHLIKSRLNFIIIKKTMKCFYKISHPRLSTEDGYFMGFLVQNSLNIK